jgi:hypothetical protein
MPTLLTKCYQNNFSSTLKESYTMIKWDSSPECKNGLTYTNQSLYTNQQNDELKSCDNIRKSRDAIWQCSIFLNEQFLYKLGIHRVLLNKIKAAYEKLTAIVLNAEKWILFPFRTKTLTTSTQHNFEDLDIAIRQEK